MITTASRPTNRLEPDAACGRAAQPTGRWAARQLQLYMSQQPLESPMAN